MRKTQVSKTARCVFLLLTVRIFNNFLLGEILLNKNLLNMYSIIVDKRDNYVEIAPETLRSTVVELIREGVTKAFHKF